MNLRKIAPTPSAFAYPLLIKRILDHSTRLEPDREIVYRDRMRYTYFELRKRVARLANVFKNLGLNGGETIAVMDYDSHRYLESFFAIPMTGHVIHTINWRLSPTQILYTINHAEDVVILAHADFVPLLNQLAGQFTTVRHVIVAAEDAPLPEATLPVAGEYEALLAAAPDQYAFEDFDEDAVATTFYTTGTTGNPKGVFFTHRQIVLHTLAIAIQVSSLARSGVVTNADVYMPLTPFFHVHAWGFPFVATLLNMKQVYVGKFEPETTLKLFLTHQPTISHCVPTILQLFVGHPAVQQVDLSKWKVLIGGSALPKALAKAALARGIEVSIGYGMSETCPILSGSYLSRAEQATLDLDAEVEARIRAGAPAVLVELRVVDEAGHDVPPDDETMGEVVTRAPWLTQGYFKEPEKSEELWRGGWLHTGDVATINQRGFIKIADRIKDVIKTGGEWVSSIELESLISLHPAVAEVAVVGVPDAKWGERPHASIALKPGHTATDDDIRTHLQPFVERGDINKWTVPETIAFVEAIPKTSVGKMDKKVIRAGLMKV